MAYLSLNLRRYLGDLFSIPNIALVNRHTPRLPRLQLRNIKHRHRRPTHAIHLRDQQPQPARAACNHNNLLPQIDDARLRVRDLPVQDPEEEEEGEQRGVQDRGLHHGTGPGIDLRAQAEGDHPGHEGVEEGDVGDFEEEVDGEGGGPGVGGGGGGGVVDGHCWLWWWWVLEGAR